MLNRFFRPKLIIGTLPQSLTNGTTADASQVMSDLNYIVNQVNANAAPLASPSFTGTVTSAGPVDISGAGAGQIKFPATQHASADINTLDDYAEGAWTPAFSNLTVTLNGGTVVYTGNYTKIGRLVFWEALITITGGAVTSSLSGTTFINNLPFTVGTTSFCCSINVSTAASYGTTGVLTATTNAYTPTWTSVNQSIMTAGIFQV